MTPGPLFYFCCHSFLCLVSSHRFFDVVSVCVCISTPLLFLPFPLFLFLFFSVSRWHCTPSTPHPTPPLQENQRMQTKLDALTREAFDLQETINWKDKKIGVGGPSSDSSRGGGGSDLGSAGLPGSVSACWRPVDTSRYSGPHL